jgi:hypothetical protein
MAAALAAAPAVAQTTTAVCDSGTYEVEQATSASSVWKGDGVVIVLGNPPGNNDTCSIGGGGPQPHAFTLTGNGGGGDSHQRPARPREMSGTGRSAVPRPMPILTEKIHRPRGRAGRRCWPS